MNELLFCITLIFNFSCILAAYRWLGKTGLYCWIALASVIASIEVIKCVDIFGLSLTLGNVIYGSTFLATDILSARHGKKAAQRGVLVGFASMVVFLAMTQATLLFKPNSADFASPALATVFSLTPRIVFGSLVAYLTANMLDTYLFHWLHRFPLWVRNNGSTMASQFIDTWIFTFIAFWGVYDLPLLVELFWTTYAIKVLIAACDTPFIYLACRKDLKSGENC